jgi:YrbI family 3-deoxy-D-manno-octulosonate 8-phosphate phosphatase
LRLSEESFRLRAGELEWLLCDVDGVLTDGRLYYDGRGERLKAFNARDGLGLKLAQRAGIRVGLLSARRSPALRRRARDLGLDVLLAGESDKRLAFESFLEKQRSSPARAAYIGDDLPDMAVLAICGLSFAPGDAVEDVRAVVHTVLQCPGGAGAVREMVELILRAREVWQQVLRPFMAGAGDGSQSDR